MFSPPTFWGSTMLYSILVLKIWFLFFIHLYWLFCSCYGTIYIIPVYMVIRFFYIIGCCRLPLTEYVNYFCVIQFFKLFPDTITKQEDSFLLLLFKSFIIVWVDATWFINSLIYRNVGMKMSVWCSRLLYLSNSEIGIDMHSECFLSL